TVITVLAALALCNAALRRDWAPALPRWVYPERAEQRAVTPPATPAHLRGIMPRWGLDRAQSGPHRRPLAGDGMAGAAIGDVVQAGVWGLDVGDGAVNAVRHATFVAGENSLEAGRPTVNSIELWVGPRFDLWILRQWLHTRPYANLYGIAQTRGEHAKAWV